MTAVAAPAQAAPAARRTGVLLWLAAVAGLAAIALAQGLLPGMVNAETISYFGESSVRCMHDLGASAITSWCHAYGEPGGFPLLTGGPVILVGALLMYLPGVDSLGGFIAAQLVFDAIALAGGYGLMRRLGAGRWVALGTAVAYGLSPTVIGMEGFGGTFTGFALLPAYAFVDVVVADALAPLGARGGAPGAAARPLAGRRLALLLVAYAFVRTTALFMDGYSFVASALVGLCLWIAWGSRRGLGMRTRLAGLAAFAGANAVAYVIYTVYVPVDYLTSPIEIFRAMGLDVVTVFEPSNYIWIASKFGFQADHTVLWGDTSNSMYNYAGYVCTGLALAFLIRNRRARRPLALAAAGLIALVLSLGPAVKVHDVRTPGATVYAMPQGLAPELPWAQALVKTPGLKEMRATYRWFGVTRLALVVLAGLMVAELARGPGRGRQVAALVLAGAAVVELLPTVPLFVRNYRAQYQDRTQVQAQVAAPLARLTKPGERVFFLNYDGAHNDFLANYLASADRLRAYNAGGDKNALFAMSRWPDQVKAMAAAGVGPAAVEAALRDGTVDAVVVPFFHLQGNSAIWPPAPETVAAARGAFGAIVADKHLRVQQTPWFAVVRRGT